MDFWLVTTDHLSERILFRNDEDYKVAMNYVAVVKHVTGVNILAFILMSNHVHFVLECNEVKAYEFINRFKNLYGRYLRSKYGQKEMMRRISVDVRALRLEDESLKRAIAYVIMNSVDARLCLYANQYSWGSGAVYFCCREPQGIVLGSFSKKAQRRLLLSHEVLDQNWLVLEDSYISPASVVSFKFVESLYRSAGRMDYYLKTSSKAPSTAEQWDRTPSFSDQTLAAAVIDLKRTMFHKGDRDELTKEQWTGLARQLRRRFSMDINQLRRLTGLSNEEALSIFDSF